VVKLVAGTVNPLSIIRAAGPYGPGLISKYRKDIENKFKHIYADTGVVSKYIYHLNAQDPSGESAFATLNESLGWAKNPLEERLPALDSNIPVTMLYGSVSRSKTFERD
jgi:abhydrolase domain-containing protein 4